MGPGACIESDKDAPTVEPPLQHKKHVDGPPTSLSTEYLSKPPDAPDYTLLGQQERFSQNVKYQTKQSVPGGIYKNKENFDSAPPPPKQLKMQKRIKPLIKERHPPVSTPSYNLSDARTSSSPPPAPRGHKDNIELKEAMKDKDLRDVLGDKPAVSKSEEQKPQAAQNGQKKQEVSYINELVQTGTKKGTAVSIPVTRETMKDKDLRDVLGGQPAVSKLEEQAHHTAISKSEDQVHQKRKKKEERFKLNESVQTNMKKGVAISSPEAPADYALRYKAHIPPPRPVKRFSEYQKQFQWKDNLKTSPLLSAEEIVFKSKADLGPYKIDGVQRVSEYTRQFHPWQPGTYSSDMALNLNNSNKNNNNNKSGITANRKKKQKVKRSKSTEAVVQQDEFIDVEDDKKVAESDLDELKSKLRKSHGKTRHFTTEYRANYKSPTSYRYEHGTWRGGYPPQLMLQFTDDEDIINSNANNNKNDNNKNNNNNNAENSSSANWFAEVIELRCRAEEYRKRAQGTHFSREHLVQLLAKQNECWDSEPSSTIKALNLETPAGRAKVSKKLPESHSSPGEVHTEENSPVMSDVDHSEQEQETLEEGGTKMKERKDGRKSQVRRSRKMAWLEEQKEKVAQQRRRLEEERSRLEHDDSDDDDVAIDEKLEGRIPTPVLQQSDSPVRRHHLDRTTPSVGGALLSCPPSKDNKMIVTSRTGFSYVTASDDVSAKPLHKSYNVDKLHTMPIYGKPSEDTHYMRNDSADLDRRLKTQYVTSPPLTESDEDKENQDKETKRRNRNLRSTDLTAVPEGYGRTYNVSKPFLSLADIRNDSSPNDDDVMSVSLMSVASSSSLASDIFERTKKRQEFWNKKTNNTH